MRFPSRNKHRAHCTFRVSTTVLAIAVLPFLLHARAPSWWTQRGVLVENKAADDYAEANQGQLKNIARAAAVEMDARLTGGAGDNIHRLIASWSVVDTRTNDFAPINLGQLKNIAKPFYDRLISVGLPEVYPWLRSQSLADDFAVANIGQVKNLFSFGIPAANVLDDARGDRLAANDASANLAVESHSVWIWGDHLISGTDFERNFPRRITELSAVKAVTAGEHHLATLHVDGSVSVWGDNDAGQLGDGTNVSRPAPALLSNLSNITSIKAGGWHTLALQQDGTILAWGDNAYGQLGTGDTNGSLVPTPVIGLDNIIKISASAFRSVALKIDGTVWSWGYERYNGVDVYDPTPLLAPSLADVLEIAAGYEHTVAVKSDGTVWVWGSNYSNQLGNGSSRSIYQAVPLQVPGLSNITKVASSYDHTLAIANDGTVWAWGYNAFGQLGDGTSDQKPTPVRVAGLTDIIAIATTYSSSFAMKTDGTVWAWGDFAPGVLPGTNPRVPQQVGLGLFDSNHNGMDDRWEIHFFGNLDQAGDADFDGDGISNQAEYLRGTDPTDYYNGATPVIEIAGGNNQLGAPGTFLTKPFKVRVRNAAGQILVNAPIKFAIANRLGGLATIGGGAQQQAIRARTDGNGEAFVYHALPNIAGTSTRTTVAAGDTIILAAVTFRAITPFSPPPQPTPPPDPNASPTPTPDPSATPIAPYRHAIIDLGKDVHPLRINNKGWILAQGYDSNGNWGNFRWKGGVLEQLNYSGPNTIVQPQDMNDAGAVVGLFSSNGSWLSNKENELFAGLLWPADNANAVKISAPSAPRTFEPQIPGTFRKAELSAVNNRGDVYGEACTGTVRGFANHTIMVMNALIWPGGVAPPEQLSFATATNNPPDSHLSSWQGTSDRISRANGARHYIGRKTTSYTADGVLQETSTGMIDGQAADFEPIDLNESGIVVGNKPSNGPMVIRTLGSPTPADVQVPNTFPIAINDHSRPSTATGDQVSPTATPQPTPIPAPQVLAWTGNALALWELQSDGQTWHPFG
ncbi:MAG: RCC1 domain-containing protein, partial [Chthoniobacterales bacterium]